MQNELEINIVNSHAVYEDSSNILLHDEINKQLSNNAGYVQIDLSFEYFCNLKTWENLKGKFTQKLFFDICFDIGLTSRK